MTDNNPELRCQGSASTCHAPDCFGRTRRKQSQKGVEIRLQMVGQKHVKDDSESPLQACDGSQDQRTEGGGSCSESSRVTVRAHLRDTDSCYRLSVTMTVSVGSSREREREKGRKGE